MKISLYHHKLSMSDPEEDATEPTSKRRNLGRKGRHRVKKLLEIEAAGAAAASTTALPTIIPTDRNYVWPAVQELCELSKSNNTNNNNTANDEQALLGQLGYLPGNALSVAARASDAFPECAKDDSSPLVLKLYPLVLRDESDGTKRKRKRQKQQHQEASTTTTISEEIKSPLMEPFPTIYWVTHPRIKALISKLELDKWGTKLEKRLQEESDALESMQRAHKEYGQERYNMITTEDREWIQQRKWDAAFAVTRGVAGIRNYASIKCLHAHAAHYWSGCQDNIVGKWVAKEVSSLLQKDRT